MATTPTTNPVPSEKPQDLKFNAGKIDEFVTSFAQWYVDRFGKQHYTIEGLKQLALQQIYNLGWNLKGTFQGGGTVTVAGDLLQDTTSLIWYRWDDLATLPKTVPAGSTPSSSGGTGPGKWQPVDVADVLRKDLAKPTGAGMVGATNTDGTTRTVQEFLLANDSAEYRAQNIAKLAAVNYKIRTLQPLTVLFQGDSITAGYDVGSTDKVPAENGDWATHASMTYPKRFVDFMLEQCGVSVTPVYRAISGYTAQQAVNEPLWQTNPNCDLAFVMYGINDYSGTAGATHESYMAAMETLIRRLIKWGCGVVVMTCGAGGQGARNPGYQIWAQQAKNMAKVYGCRFFDAHEVHYNRLYGTVQSDSLHFNSIGYARIGEALTSMCGAGGLLDTYEPIRHEVQIWGGNTDNHIGYTNPGGNIDLGYASGAYTNPGITGILANNKACLMAYHFYQDCEALEVDIIGSWADGGLQVISGDWYRGSVTYYRDSITINNERSQGFKGSFANSLLYNKDSTRAGQPKFVGTLYGKGWKTVTIFNKTDGTSPTDQFIQMFTVRPVNLRKANPVRRGQQWGNIGVIRQMLPDSIGANTGDPTPITWSTVVLPMPDALKGTARDNKASPFDCGVARVILKATGGTFANHLMEGLLYKTASGVDTFTFTPTYQSGAVADWPVFTFTKSQKAISNLYTANQVAPNMPLRDVPFVANDVANGSGRPDLGDWLSIRADWTAVSGGQKTALWEIEIWGMEFNGAPVASAV